MGGYLFTGRTYINPGAPGMKMIAFQQGRILCSHCNKNVRNYACLQAKRGECEYEHVCRGCESIHPIDHVLIY